MTTYLAHGSSSTTITNDELDELVTRTFARFADRNQILLVPPDFTRYHSRAGRITNSLYKQFGPAVSDVLPALGTHVPMPLNQRQKMFPDVPNEIIRDHDWRNDVETIGIVPKEFVTQATEGIYQKDWPAQLNRMVWQGGHDLIVSVGQVVPHEVIGMANHNKNLFVGTGGAAGINESHYIGAVYGMERMMGRADTPLRRILDEAERLFCGHLPIVYVLTVVGSDASGELVTRGLFIGDDRECFQAASELSLEVNFTLVDRPLEDVVVFLDPEEFHSTWLGNKGIYRTRMAIADGGSLTILAPKVNSFGEDPTIDKLIRKYGYRSSAEIVELVAKNADLRDNLSAAAHLIHGSSEGRFSVTYCTSGLSREEIEGVGYQHRDLQDALDEFPIDRLKTGWNSSPRRGSFYFIKNPAQGLWASEERLKGQTSL